MSHPKRTQGNRTTNVPAKCQWQEDPSLHRDQQTIDAIPSEDLSRDWWGCKGTSLCRATPHTRQPWCKCESCFTFSLPIYELHVSFLRGVLSDNQIFYLQNCKTTSGKFVMLSLRVEQLQECCVGEVLQGRRSECSRANGLHTDLWKSCQVTRPALKHDEDDRATFRMIVGEHFLPEQLVFADESHFNWISLQRPFAWAPRGNRARWQDFFVCGRRYLHSKILWVHSHFTLDTQFSLLCHSMVFYT